MGMLGKMNAVNDEVVQVPMNRELRHFAWRIDELLEFCNGGKGTAHALLAQGQTQRRSCGHQIC